MNELALAVLRRIEATYQANFLWLKEAAPDVFAALDHPSHRTVDMTPDEHGVLTIVINDPDFGRVEVPQAALWGAVSIQVKEMDGPLRSVVRVNASFDAAPTDDDMDQPSVDGVSWLMLQYGEDVTSHPSQDVRRFFAKVKPAELPRYPQFGKKFIPILIMIGAGDGWQIDRMIDHYDVRHLIIADYDPTGIKMSMCFTDYIGLTERCKLEGRQLTLIIERNPEALANQITNAIVRFWPPYFVHGAAFFHGVQVKEDTEKLKKKLADSMRMVHIGWGFFEDELASLRHSWSNLTRGIPLYTRGKKLPEGCRAIICGAGPSLDGMIDFIKLNADNLTVFSCGTALKALYKAGIKPDFHIEMERPAGQVNVLKRQAPAEFLKSLTLICPPLVYPDLVDLVGDVLMLTKSKDAATFAFLQGYPIFATGPTVTNTAISFTAAMGFDEVILCGVDYGWVSEDKHHAQNTLYDENEEFNYGEGGKKVNLAKWKPSEGDLIVKGNFRDEVKCDPIFDAARRGAENEVLTHPEIRFFNTADGAAISATHPLKLNDPKFVLRAQPTSKAVVDAEIRSCFAPVDGEKLLERAVLAKRNSTSYISRILNCLPDHIDSREHFLEVLAIIRSDREPEDIDDKSAWVAVSGTLLVYCRLIYAMQCALESESKVVELANHAIDNLKQLLIDMSDQISHWEQWPENFKPKAAGIAEEAHHV